MIGTSVKSFGVIGKNISYTLSPQIFLHISDLVSKPVNYQAYNHTSDQMLNVATIEQLSQGLSGWNVTIPYKQEILKHCDVKTSDVELIGAANTVSIQNNKIVAANTDVFGVLKALEGLDLQNKKILVLGAGGAARAAVLALSQLGVSEVTICNRSVDRATKLIDDLQSSVKIKLYSVDSLESVDGVYNGIIHARPYGDDNYDSAIKHLLENAFVFDMVYRPKDTRLKLLAQAQGLKYVDGLNMLIWQALKSWDIWFQESDHKVSTDKSIFTKIYNKISEEIL